METETVEIEPELQFEKQVRDYVLRKLGKTDDETFIQKVEICPNQVEVAVRADE
jgi:hypothetical protein